MSSEEKNGSATAEKEMPQADPVKNENKEKDAKKRLKKLENEVAELKKQLEAAKEASAAENDKYLRMMAEYDNFRKRSAKEKRAFTPTLTATVSRCSCRFWTIWSGRKPASNSTH